MKPAIQEIGVYALMLTLATPALFGLDVLARMITNSEFSPRIKSPARLEQLLEQEKKKLNCAKEIKAELFGHPIPHAAKNKDGTYQIMLNGNLATEAILKHELYHICDGHVDGGYSTLKYFLWEEPQAILYETLNLKL